MMEHRSTMVDAAASGSLCSGSRPVDESPLPVLGGRWPGLLSPRGLLIFHGFRETIRDLLSPVFVGGRQDGPLTIRGAAAAVAPEDREQGQSQGRAPEAPPTRNRHVDDPFPGGTRGPIPTVNASPDRWTAKTPSYANVQV
jgi:hypothetical protein